ncbi:hypothetical protein CLIB1423_09S01090 [[Candida] railenensis]|uniref:Uncharacterized protein n=1 Tax=[Candida] railenensis TaxID=45579 RepID=A0A9P0QQE6_9ASCO|nr:hypothetical protein CLIB1423_09S01090 [[Candida] railenensis]
MPTSRSSNGKSRPASATNGNGYAKWTDSVRALPSNSESNDYLKPDYIEVNLNNSRKLIENINQLSENAENGIEISENINKSLLLVNNVSAALEWLEEV